MRGKLVFQFISEPSDVNYGGKVHGGEVMKWIDQIAYACAMDYSGEYCVTVYVGGIRFLAPISIGALVKLEAEVIHTGKSSIHIAVDVFSRDVKKGEFIKTTHCVIVFVAVDKAGKPTPVEKFVPVTDEQYRHQQYAVRLNELRSAVDKEMMGFIES
jgi:acyl-CoA hydrolase